MSTRYISVLLSPDLAASVLGISLRSTERSQQPVELGAISAAESDSEVRALPGGQQLELVLGYFRTEAWRMFTSQVKAERQSPVGSR
jgi:hypothetical protein